MNRVTVNGSYCKPSRELREGDTVEVRKLPVTYSFRVKGLVSNRQPAKNVPLYAENITPQTELDKLNIPRETRATAERDAPPKRNGVKSMH